MNLNELTTILRNADDIEDVSKNNSLCFGITG